MDITTYELISLIFAIFGAFALSVGPIYRRLGQHGSKIEGLEKTVKEDVNPAIIRIEADVKQILRNGGQK